MNWPNLELFSRCSLTRELFTYTKLLEYTVYTYFYSTLPLPPDHIFNIVQNISFSSIFLNFDRIYQKIVTIF